jgi:hypothetical protein
MTLTEFVGGDDEEARIRRVSEPLDKVAVLGAARGQDTCRPPGKACRLQKDTPTQITSITHFFLLSVA